jgi:arylsulfatase A-like enzyme
MARRLVEAGARFVMVDYGYDPDYGNLWDNHNAPSQNHPHISKMCRRGYHVAGIDRAFAALIGDLEQRGMLNRTLVVFLTEFGRTPKINDRGGRDHWGACGSLFFTGAGTRVGQVIGESDSDAAYPVTRGYSPADVAATIYTALGIPPETRVRDRENRPLPLLDHGEPIAEIAG